MQSKQIFLVLVARQAEHLERQEFDGAQQFAAALQKQRRIGPGKFHQNFGPLPIAVARNRRVHGDAVFQAQTTVS